MKKRLLSLLLALVMLVGMIPMNSLTAHAAELTEAKQTANIDVPFTSDSKAAPGSSMTVDLDALAEQDEAFMDAYFNNGDIIVTWYLNGTKVTTNIGGSFGEAIYLKDADKGKSLYVTIETDENTYTSKTFTVETLPVLLGVNVTLADILDTSDGWKPLPVDKSAVFEPGTGTASVNFSNSVLYTNGSFSTPVATVSAGGRYYFYITVTSLPEYYPVDYSKISVDHINVTMYDYKVDFLYASEYSSGAYTGMKFCFMATHNPAPQLKFDEIVLKDGEYLKSGTPITSTTKPSGGYAYYKDGVLELNNYNSSFGSLYLKDMDSVEIKVVGSNVLSKIEETYTSTNTKKYTDITFTGDGSLTVSSNTANCVKTTGNVTVNSGNLTFGGGNALSGLSAASLTVGDCELVLKGKNNAINSGCRVDAATIYVDESGATWDGTTDLSTYKYLRINEPHIYVGGVKMYDGEYLANDATTTTTTQPSGGYAYYKDGTLTLYYYSYEGKGYEYDVSAGNYSVIYTEAVPNLKINLKGSNLLDQTETASDSICVKNGSLTIDGTGYLSATYNGYGIFATQNITINGGTIDTTDQDFGIYSSYGDITINGGDITAGGKQGICARGGSVIVNGGKVTAVGSDCAIGYDTSFTVDSKMEILASTTANGELGEYVAANHDSYKNIVVKKKLGGDIFVGGVGMYSGDYLAVGATETTIIQPSGGYAYYEDGTLTLNNYSYEGVGYNNEFLDSLIYTDKDLQITLMGDNTLEQTTGYGGVYVEEKSLTIGGTGSLTCIADGFGISASYITINEGTIAVTAKNYGFYTSGSGITGSIIINDGNITVTSDNSTNVAYGLYASIGSINIKGGIVNINSEVGICAGNGHVGFYGGKATIVGSYNTLLDTTVEIGQSMFARASTTVDGALSEYVDANRENYKKIVVMEKGVIDVYVGGVGMIDGDYLAVGATGTTTAKPSGGYAYYEDGTLTLNNYSYEGKGYEYSSFSGQCAVIFTNKGLKIILMGNNTLVQTEEGGADCICINRISDKNNNCLTIEGSGSLTCTTNDKYGEAIHTPRELIINGGTIVVTKSCYGFDNNDIIINGGTIDISSTKRGIYASKGNITINGGSITVSGEQGISSYAGSVAFNDGEVTAVGSDRAIAYSTSFTVAEGMKIQASTTVDGEPGEYVAANHDSYKKIVVAPIVYHSVTFMVGTTTVDTKTIEDGKTVTAPADPTQSGKTFLGWYNGDTKFDFTTPITGDITLTAKFEDATSNITVNCIGDIDYIVSGNVVTVDHEVACKVGYLDGTAYKAITAVANGDGTYSFTAPAGVTEVLLVVKGDVSGDTNVNVADKMAVERSLLLTSHPAYQALTEIQKFAANMDSTEVINMADKMTIERSLLLTTHPAYQALTW